MKHAIFPRPSLTIAILTASAILGCADSGHRPEMRDTELATNSQVMGAVFQTLDNPFFRELNEGIKEVVESNGDRLITLDSDWQGAKQREDIASLLAMDVSVIFLNPVDWEGLQESLQVAKQRDVVCVAVDTQVKDDKLVVCQVVSDNTEAGRLAARSLAKARDSARIAILHIPSNKACIDRVAGFQQEIAGRPDMETIAIEDGKGTAEGSRPAMQALLEKYTDIDAVFAVNDPSALGAIEAIEAAGRLEEITVVSVDGSREGIAAVEAGKLFSTAVQFPREIGRIAAQRAYDHQNGNPVDRSIKVPLELVTPENVHAFRVTGSEQDQSKESEQR
jgi:ribose transport system substrate-binding protein